jgi:LmbE family N-acetylglucosaminyl deacetylase
VIEMNEEPVADKQITIMAVHAHPDDEVVFTGGTLALYSSRGVRTVLVTTTGGEEGEIHDSDLDPEEARPRLGDIRREELRRAVDILGIDHLELLGYRDSGMAGTEPNQRPDNFHNADREEATCRLVALVRRYKPQVLITYDENGAYGHPDHIMCNVITHAAFEKAGDQSYFPELGEPWQPLKLYYTHWPEEPWKQAREIYMERGLKWPWDRDEEKKPDEDPEHESIEEAVEQQVEQVTEQESTPEKPKYVPPPTTTRINVRDFIAVKREATFVHRTQFAPDGFFKTMPDDVYAVAMGEEHYSLVESSLPAPHTDEAHDILAGL